MKSCPPKLITARRAQEFRVSNLSKERRAICCSDQPAGCVTRDEGAMGKLRKTALEKSACLCLERMLVIRAEKLISFPNLSKERSCVTLETENVLETPWMDYSPRSRIPF